MYENFEDIINKNIEVEGKKTPFKINHLKISHYYWNSGEINIAMPISTSIELNSEYDFEKDKLNWNRKVTHTYLSLDNCQEETTDSYTEELVNAAETIRKLEEYDLRNLKNNYFTDDEPERFTHWEIAYNNSFKIVGTYDQELEEFKNICELLNFKKTMTTELEKVNEKVNEL